MAHITGRRLDIDDGSSLVLFHTATAVLPVLNENNNAKITGSNYIENLKQQDLKANIEKLRFRRDDAKRDSSKPTKLGNTKFKNTSNSKLTSDLNKLPARNTSAQTNVLRKTGSHVNPAETAEVRKKKALEWLHNEKKEMESKAQAKRAYLDTAKELEQRRRQGVLNEAHRRRQLQMEILHVEQYGDQPEMGDHFNTFEQQTQSEQLNFPNARVSTDSASVIEHLAEQMTLLKPTVSRPIVPRLSKNYVNRRSLIFKEGGDTHNDEQGPTDEHSSRLVLNSQPTATNGAIGGEEPEEDYGLDVYEDDFDQQPVPSSTTAIAGDKQAPSGGDGDSDAGQALRQPAHDLITARTLELAHQRREAGKLFAKQQHLRILAKEREDRLKQEQEAETRKTALERLKSRVNTINHHNENTVHLKTHADLLRERSSGTRVYKYSSDGKDFHTKFGDDAEDSFAPGDFAFTRSHLLEEEDVPLRDFLMPQGVGAAPVGERPVTADEARSVQRSVSTGSRSRQTKGATLSVVDSQQPVTKKKEIPSVTSTVAPFRFNSWAPTENAIARAKAYHNPVSNALPAPHEALRRKSTAQLKPSVATHVQLSGTRQLYPAVDSRVTKEKKKKKSKGTSKRVKRSSRSLIDDALEAEVLELLNRSDHSGPQRGSLPYNADPLGRTVNLMHNTPPRGNIRDDAVTSVQKLFAHHPSLNLPQQQPLDVSGMARRNLGEVQKVIGEVDRMCDLLNAQTALLERKLTVRESMESLDLGAMRSVLAAKLASKVSPLLSDSINRPSGEHKHNTPSLSSNDGESDEEEEEEEEEEEDSDSEATEEETYHSSEENEDDEGLLNISLSPSAAMRSSAGSDRYRQAQYSPAGSDVEQSSQEGNDSDRDDRVLMGDPSDEEEDEDESQYHDRLATSNYRGSSSVRLSHDQSLSADPVLRHQLGLAADRRHLMEKLGRLAEDAAQQDQHLQSDRFNEYSTKVASAKHLETRSGAFSAPSGRSDLPSLRNVGELATLLRTNFNKLTGDYDDKDEADGDDSQEEDDDNRSDDPENDFRAVSVMARAIAKQRAAQVAERNLKTDLKQRTETELESAFRSVSRSSHQSDEPERRSVELFDQGEVSDSPLAFWDSMLTRPLKHDLNTSRGSFSDLSLLDVKVSGSGPPLDEVAPVSRLPTTQTSSDVLRAPVAVKRSGAEMRLEMLEELRRQDEYFHYTLELSEIEKNNALQSARELQHAAKSRSEAELNQLRLQQEVELQKVAYENSLAISMANAHLVAEQNTMTQQQELLKLHSQLNLQQIQGEYALLLAQADSVSDNLEHNQKLVLMEQLLREEKDRFLLAERERLLGEERERLVAVSKEQERLMAIEREQLVATVQRQQQQHSLELTKRELEARLAHAQLQQVAIASSSVVKHVGSNRSELMTGRQLEEMDSIDEYSADFEASVASRSKLDLSLASSRGAQGRHGIPIPKKVVPFKPVASKDDDSISSEEEEYSSRFSAHDEDSIAEEDSIEEKSVEEEEDEISEEEEISDEDRVNMRDKSPPSDSDTEQFEEISEEVSASAVSARRNPPAVQKHEESSIEDEADEEEEQYSEDSIEEEESTWIAPKVKSPLQNKLLAKYVADISSDEEQSVAEEQEVSLDRQEEVSEEVSEEEDVQSSANSSDHSSEISEEQEEGERTPDVVSVVEEESVAYSEDRYDEYSDTFESKTSVASSARSAIAKTVTAGRPPLTAGNISRLPSGIAVKGRSTAEELSHMKAALLEASASMSSSGGSGTVDDAQLNAVLSQYQAEMEMRLRAHDEAHAMRVAFLGKKHAKRLSALTALTSDPEISPRQLKEERRAVDALLQEETAKLNREKWALNAKAYKEDRRFRELKRDMRAFRANLNDELAAAEMKAHILGRASKDGKRHEKEDDDSVDSVDSLSESEDLRPRRQAAASKKSDVKTVSVVSRSGIQSADQTRASLAMSMSMADHSYMQDYFEAEEQSARAVSLKSTAQRLLQQDKDSSSEVEEEEETRQGDVSDSDVDEEVPEEESHSTRRSVATASSYSISDERSPEEAGVSRQYDDFEISTAEVEEADATIDYSDSFADESDHWPQQSQSNTRIVTSVQSAQKQQQMEASQSRADLSVAYGDDFEEEVEEQSARPSVVQLAIQSEVEDDEVSEEIEEEDDDDEERSVDLSRDDHQLHQSAQETSATYTDAPEEVEDSQQQYYQSDVFDVTSSPAKAHQSTVSAAHEISSSYLQDEDAFESVEVSHQVAQLPVTVQVEQSDEDEIEEEEDDEYQDDEEEDESFKSPQGDTSSPDQDESQKSPTVVAVQLPLSQSDDEAGGEDEDVSYEEEFEEAEDDNEEEEAVKAESHSPVIITPAVLVTHTESVSVESDEEMEEEIEEVDEEEALSGGEDSDHEQRREDSRQDVGAASASMSVDMPSWTIDAMQQRPNAGLLAGAVGVTAAAAAVASTPASPNRPVEQIGSQKAETSGENGDEEEEEPSYADEFDDDYEEEETQSAAVVDKVSAPVTPSSPQTTRYDEDEDSIEEEVEEEIDEADDEDSGLLHIEVDGDKPSAEEESLSPLDRSPLHVVSTETQQQADSAEDVNRSRLSTHDSADDSVTSSSALEESKEFELELKDRKRLSVSEQLLDHSHASHHGGIASLGALGDLSSSLGAATGGDAMYFDKETQRWVGGDEVSLDGFDESVDEYGVMSPVRRKSISASHSSSQSPTVSAHKTSRDQPFLRPESQSRENSLKLDTEVIATSFSGSSDDSDVPVVMLPSASSTKPSLPSVPEPSVVDESVVEEILEEDEDSISEEVDEEVVREGGGVDDSFLSAVSEDNYVSPLLPAVTTPMLEETTGSSSAGLHKSSAAAQSSDSEKTITWNSSQHDTKDSAAVIVTTDVLPVIAMDEENEEEQYSEDSIEEEEESIQDESIHSENEEEIDAVEVSAVETKVSAEQSAIEDSISLVDDSAMADLSLEAMLDDIDSAFEQKVSKPVAVLEVSSDSTIEGSLGDLSCDFEESNVLAVKVVEEKEDHVSAQEIAEQRERQRQEENERRADEITELLMDRLLRDMPSDRADLQRLLGGGRSPSPVDQAPSSSLEDSSDSLDENTKMFIANKAAQFLSRREAPVVVASTPITPPSPPPTTPSFSLSSLSSMPSLSGGGNTHRPKSFGRSHGDHHGHNSSSDSDEDSFHGFDDALSSALGGDESPVKAHPDTSAISKELSDKAHHHVESVESLASAEVSIEIAVQDVLSHTEDFLGAVFDEKVGKQLVERLSDPNFEGSFLSAEQLQQMAANIEEGGSNIHKGAVLDRINELCDELHSLKHFPSRFTNNCTFGQRLAAQSLPMNPDMVAAHITRHVLDDQRTLVKLLQGEKGLHELLNITAIDVFKEETRAAIQDRSDQIADALMARLLINTAVEVGKVVDLEKALGIWS